MPINNQSSLVIHDSEADDQPFDGLLDEEQGGDAVDATAAGRCVLPQYMPVDFTEEDEIATPATPEQLTELKAELRSKYGFQNILSKSPLMHAVFALVNDLANAKTTVLIEGETGTGKEQIARALHGTQRSGGFVAVNCAGLPETLLESELFGHEKGAFTSAANQRRGRFELAQAGTIFLDEVGDMPGSMQAKLLRVLQERSFERVGGTQSIDLDVRVISATNRSLRRLVSEGKFREDLFYRLNVVKIELPPLCRRREDIPLLAAHFIEKHARPNGTAVKITAQALEVLARYSWPGNIRELENSIERACITSRTQFIDVQDLPLEFSTSVTPVGLGSIDLSRTLTEQVRELAEQFERRYIRKALALTHGHVGNCARLCGLSRRSVSAKIAEYQLHRREFHEE